MANEKGYIATMIELGFYYQYIVIYDKEMKKNYLMANEKGQPNSLENLNDYYDRLQKLSLRKSIRINVNCNYKFCVFEKIENYIVYL